MTDGRDLIELKVALVLEIAPDHHSRLLGRIDVRNRGKGIHIRAIPTQRRVLQACLGVGMLVVAWLQYKTPDNVFVPSGVLRLHDLDRLGVAPLQTMLAQLLVNQVLVPR